MFLDFATVAFSITVLFGDKKRLAIALLLAQNKEQTVNDLCDHLCMGQSAVSHHLALLRNSDVVSVRREGKWSYYSLNTEMMAMALPIFRMFAGMPDGADTIDFTSFQTYVSSGTLERKKSPIQKTAIEREVFIRDSDLFLLYRKFLEEGFNDGFRSFNNFKKESDFRAWWRSRDVDYRKKWERYYLMGYAATREERRAGGKGK